MASRTESGAKPSTMQRIEMYWRNFSRRSGPNRSQADTAARAFCRIGGRLLAAIADSRDARAERRVSPPAPVAATNFWAAKLSTGAVAEPSITCIAGTKRAGTESSAIAWSHMRQVASSRR